MITALSPCMLPVLPILLAGAATGNRKRPLAIVGGLVASFTLFTLAGAWLLNVLGLPQDFLRTAAIVLLFLLAATLVFPKLGMWVERPFYRLTRHQPGADTNGFLLGAGLGLVFVPCAGPVLGAITFLSATGAVGIRTIAITLAYAAGAAIPMLAIAYGGQRLAGSVKALRTHAEATRRAAGVLLGATALLIALGIDQRITTAIPNYTQGLQKQIEESDTARAALRDVRTDGDAQAALVGTESTRAPELRGLSDWINTPDGRSLTLKQLRGKVVLVDFWTYSCINCIRTFSHLKAWDRAYSKDGLVILGIHTPEFAFERVPGNVRGAVKRFGLRYPVALDNGYKTWGAFHNEYWPAKYLIDKKGIIRYTHFGEGRYGETESFIRRLLGERVSGHRTKVADRTPTEVTTPETYLGYARLEHFTNRIVEDKRVRYRFPARPLGLDRLAYAGEWRVGFQQATAKKDARLGLHFRARRVHIVLAGKGTVDVLVNGRRVRTLSVSGLPRLYTAVELPRQGRGRLELRVAPGIAAYAFTFS